MADRHSEDRVGKLVVVDTVRSADADKCGGSKARKSPDLPQMVLSAAAKYWKIVLVIVLLLLSHKHAVNFWVSTWSKDNSYYSHGPLVPVIAMFMLWANRKRIETSRISPSWIGLPLMLLAVPVFIFGHWSSSGALLGVTFFLFLIGATLLFFGVRGSRFVIFPLLYLMFMVPLPATLLDEATFGVQMQSTKVAAQMLELSGYETHQIGTRIESYELPQPLIVGEACSGFRLLISLLTFTAFFVYMVQASAWKKALLTAIALPLSLFINSLRITMIGYAGIWTGSAEVMHDFHDWSGYLGLIICFVILFGVAKLIKANEFVTSFPPRPDASDAEASGVAVYGRGWHGCAAIAVIALLVTVKFGIAPLDASAKGRLNRSDVPKFVGHWASTDIPIEKRIRDALWTADLLQRVYVDSYTGRPVTVWLEAARDTTAFHDPHSCLPGGGTPITEDRVVTIKLTRPRPLTIKATLLQASGEVGTSYIIHWYMIGDQSYASTPQIHKQVRIHQVQSFFRQLAHPLDRKAMKNEQYYWYRFSTEDWSGDSKSDIAALRRFIADFFAHTQNLAHVEERRGS